MRGLPPSELRVPPGRMQIPYIDVSPDASVREFLSPLAGATLNLIGHRPSSLLGAQSLLRSGKIVTVLATVRDLANATLSTSIAVECVLFPPLLALVETAPTVEQYEALRVKGVAHILHVPLSLERDTNVFANMENSPSWTSASLERMPLPDVLQSMAMHRQSGMLTIMTDRTPVFSPVPFHKIESACGRLYMIEGRLLHAETPKHQGIAALAEMITIKGGYVRIHEAFLAPSHPTLDGALHANLLDAACHNDEQARQNPRASRPAPRSSWRPPAGPTRPEALQTQVDSAESFADLSSTPPQERPTAPPPPESELDQESSLTRRHTIPQEPLPMSQLQPLLALSTDLRAVARADRQGNVVDRAGAEDAESLCAIVSMGATAIERAGELLGLGARLSYSLSGKKLALYVHERSDGFVVAIGEPHKNVDSTMVKLSEKIGSMA
jgi:hypothetical protein